MSTTNGANNLSLTIGTPGEATRFTVETANWRYTGSVSRGSPVVVSLPSELQLTGNDYFDRHKAVHVYSLSRQPIFVLGETFDRISHAAFPVYPHRSFEGLFQYEYSIISTSDYSRNYRSEFLLVGCEDNTVIYITPSQYINLPKDTQLSVSNISGVSANNISHRLTMHRMQTLLVLSYGDLTGTVIVSNKPLTVISGHECAYTPIFYNQGCEPLIIQIPPSATWGTRFLIVNGQLGNHVIKGVQTVGLNREQETSFICGRENYTSTTNPDTRVISYSSNILSFVKYNYDEFCYVETIDPSILSRYSAYGDPSLSVISPISQYVHEVDFIILPSSRFPLNYVSITVPPEHFDPDRILLNNAPIDCVWITMCNGSDCLYDDEDVLGFGCIRDVSSDYLTPTQYNVAHADMDGVLSVTVFGRSLLPPRSYYYLAGQTLKTGMQGLP